VSSTRRVLVQSIPEGLRDDDRGYGDLVRVIVIGATGNIGTSVLEALAADRTVGQVVGVARREPAVRLEGASFVAADMTTAELDDTLDGADAVVQLAWAFQPTHDPVSTWNTNVRGTIRVLGAAARVGVGAVVYASSVGAYSPGPGRTVDETWPTHSLPTAAYGREKAYLERVLDAFELAHPQIRVVRVRPCFVFQRAAASEQARIFAHPLLPRQLVRPGRLPILPLPTDLRFQAVHASDLADAIRMLTVGGAHGAYNVAADPVIDAEVLGELLQARTISVPQRLARFAVGAAWRARLVRADDRLLELFLELPTLDTTKMRALGWSPRHSGPDALAELVHGIADGAGAATAPLHPPSGRVTVA
jgi:UDP-glucose 4-epimerase